MALEFRREYNDFMAEQTDDHAISQQHRAISDLYQAQLDQRGGEDISFLAKLNEGLHTFLPLHPQVVFQREQSKRSGDTPFNIFSYMRNRLAPEEPKNATLLAVIKLDEVLAKESGQVGIMPLEASFEGGRVGEIFPGGESDGPQTRERYTRVASKVRIDEAEVSLSTAEHNLLNAILEGSLSGKREGVMMADLLQYVNSGAGEEGKKRTAIQRLYQLEEKLQKLIHGDDIELSDIPDKERIIQRIKYGGPRFINPDYIGRISISLQEKA